MIAITLCKNVLEKLSILIDSFSVEHCKFMKSFSFPGGFPLQNYHIKFITERISIRPNYRIE